MDKPIATILIKQATPSNRSWERLHWRKQHEAKNQWKWMVLQARNSAAIPQATGKRVVKVCRYGMNLLDKDNLYGGCKPLMDALTNAGLIVDDNPAMCDLHVEQVKIGRSGVPYTSVELFDVVEGEDA